MICQKSVVTGRTHMTINSWIIFPPISNLQVGHCGGQVCEAAHLHNLKRLQDSGWTGKAKLWVAAESTLDLLLVSAFFCSFSVEIGVELHCAYQFGIYFLGCLQTNQEIKVDLLICKTYNACFFVILQGLGLVLLFTASVSVSLSSLFFLHLLLLTHFGGKSCVWKFVSPNILA